MVSDFFLLTPPPPPNENIRNQLVLCKGPAHHPRDDPFHETTRQSWLPYLSYPILCVGVCVSVVVSCVMGMAFLDVCVGCVECKVQDR